MANRKFSPIFNATITFGAVATSVGKNKAEYAKSVSDVTLPDGQTVQRTVMAFGDQLASVKPVVSEGNTAELAVQFDGGTLKVIGYPRPKAAAEAKAA